ncbi:tRNA (adenosine(37)-N6)-threonylcarbamoyltransferase complex ATPase subunit type 1 TsaE [bacterium]|nr:tRNA (adenosine(37)-N6)-threonylcarbamoyltransferase complex ATPase subunit type 1 TsaE [bacterium]
MDQSSETRSPQQTVETARAFAASIRPGDVIALSGPLGAGKTLFARGVIAALQGGLDTFQGSPTFALVQEYLTAAFPVYHFDFYRIRNARELFDIGWDEYCSGRAVCIVEWAERFPEVLPGHTRWVTFEITGDELRVIRFSQPGQRGL